MSWKFYGLGVLTVSAVGRGGGAGAGTAGELPQPGTMATRPILTVDTFGGGGPGGGGSGGGGRRWLGGGRGQQLSVEVADWQKTKKYSRENCK